MTQLWRSIDAEIESEAKKTEKWRNFDAKKNQSRNLRPDVTSWRSFAYAGYAASNCLIRPDKQKQNS